jgi:hypothetical protein
MGKQAMNPKHIQAQKDGKLPLEHLVVTMFPLDAAVHKHGADKYGVKNWRIDKILASTYEGAMLRHLTAWITGEDTDPDSGQPHLTHLRACCAVVLDAQMHGTLIDDRGRMESKAQSPQMPLPYFGFPLPGLPVCAVCGRAHCTCEIERQM